MEIKGNGSVIALENKPRRKCRHWKLQVSVGRHPSKPGSYCKKSRNFRGSWTEANIALEEFKSELRATKAIDLDSPTVAQLCDQWLDDRILSGNFSQRTLRSNKDRLSQYKFHIGNLYVKDLTASLINQVHKDMLSGKTPSGRPVSRTTINSAYKTFKQVLKVASRRRLVSEYLLEDITAVSTDTKEARALTSDEIVRFIDKLDVTDPRDLALLLFLMEGFRRSEVLALRWEDYTGDMIYVNFALEENGALGATKNDASKSSVPVIPSLKLILDNMKATHEALLVESHANISIDECFIIRNGLSCNFKPRDLTRWWTKRRKELGFDGLKIHELRHSFATELKRRNLDLKDRQALLRHASSKTTNDIYTHVNSEDKVAAVVPLEVQFAPNLRQKIKTSA